MSSPSRAATNDLLHDLRSARWRPAAWARFFGSAGRRSWAQAHLRPRAVTEVTALHAGLAALGRRHRHPPGARWVAASWALSVVHLGMLESNRSLGIADVVTLVRANLPVIAPDSRRLLAILALTSDLLDGRVARSRGTVTPFGRDADSLADAAFWLWFAFRHEASSSLRLLALATWAMPAALVVAISIRRGEMVEPPRSRRARPAAILQAALAIRALARHRPRLAHPRPCPILAAGSRKQHNVGRGELSIEEQRPLAGHVWSVA